MALLETEAAIVLPKRYALGGVMSMIYITAGFNGEYGPKPYMSQGLPFYRMDTGEPWGLKPIRPLHVVEAFRALLMTDQHVTLVRHVLENPPVSEGLAMALNRLTLLPNCRVVDDLPKDYWADVELMYDVTPIRSVPPPPGQEFWAKWRPTRYIHEIEAAPAAFPLGLWELLGPEDMLSDGAFHRYVEMPDELFPGDWVKCEETGNKWVFLRGPIDRFMPPFP
jgi:hypothetical protein